MKVLLFLFGLLTSPFLLADIRANSLLENFEKRNYNPAQKGLRKLSFKVKMNGLKESLKAQTIIDVKDVFFQINWRKTEGFEIVVEGLPRGFDEIRSYLKILLIDKLYFVIPQVLKGSFEEYESSFLKKNGNMEVSFHDSSYLRPITKAIFLFDQSGQLLSTKFQTAVSIVKTKFFREKKSWSKDLYVLKKMELEKYQNQVMNQTFYEIDYEKVGRFYFPSTLTISGHMQAQGKKEKEALFGETKSKILFFDYKLD